MIALPSQEAFESIITTLYSPNNVERKEAEAVYNTLMGNPTWLCRAHLAVMRMSSKDDTRYMCGILLRRILSPDTKYLTGVQAEERDAILSDLTTLFRTPDLPQNVRRGVTLCLSSLIQRNDDPGDINDPEVAERVAMRRLDCMPFLLQTLAQGDTAMRHSATMVLKQIAASIVGSFLTSNYVDDFTAAMQHCFKDPDLKVRASAVAAVTQFVIMEDEHIEKFNALVPQLLDTLQQTLQEGNQTGAAEILESLVYICENNVSFFSSHINVYVQAMLQIAASPNVEVTVLSYCIEFLLTFCEKKPKIARSLSGFPRSFFELCINLCMHPPECDNEWATSYDTDENADDIEAYDVGLEGLDRLACALKGKCVEPIAREFILRYSKSASWQERQAACSCIGQVAEGCHDTLKSHLSHIVPLLVQSSTDAHPRVRYAAISALAQLLTDFQGELGEHYPIMIPVMLALMRDNVPRLQAIAAAAVCNFTGSADRDDVEAHANQLLEGAFTLLHSTQYMFVKEQCLTAIAAVAENCGEMFGAFYPTLTPVLRSILELPQSAEVQKIQCRALEALTLMAIAVGKQVFAGDAPGVCTYLLQQQAVERETDDEFMRYIVRAWANMARCLKEDIAPYLGGALQPVLHITAQEIKITILNDGEDEDNNEEEGTQVIALSIRDVGEKRMKVNTALIGDVSLAMTMLTSLLEHVGPTITPYLDAIIERITPLIHFKYVEEVRISAVQCAGHCVGALHQLAEQAPTPMEKAAMMQRVDALAAHFLGPFREQLRKEGEVLVVSELLTALYTMINNASRNFIPESVMLDLTATIMEVFKESTDRRVELYKQLADEDDEDADELLGEHEDEEQLLIEVVETIGSLLKTHEIFLPVFLKDFLPTFALLLDENAGHVEHKIALCVLDDFMDHKPVESLPFFDKITGALIKYGVAEDWSVVQAACFGLGLAVDIMRQHPQVKSNELIELAGKTLFENFSRTMGDDDDETLYYSAIANAGSSTLKLLSAFPQETQGKDVILLQALLNHLPFREDEIEARFIHRTLMEKIKEGHPYLCSQQATIRAKLLTCMDGDVLCDQTKALLQ